MPRRLALPLAVVSSVATAAFIWLTGVSGPTSVAILTVAVAAHLALVLARPSGDALPPAVVLALSVGLVVAAVAARPVGTDLWAYQMYGRTVVEHDASPYLHPPADFPRDPVLARMQGSWVGTRAEYGPVLVGTAVVVAAATGTNELAGRLAWQGLCGAAVLAAVVLVWRRTGSSVAMAALGLNPLVIYHLVNLAHNDALVGLAVLGAVLLARDERDTSAALLLTAAALIKAPAGVGLIALLVWLLFRRGAWPAVRAGAAAGVAGLAAIAVAGGRDAIDPMLGARGRANSFTPWNLLRGGADVFTGNGMHELPLVTSDRMATAALATSVVLAIGVAVARSWRPTATELAPPQPAPAPATPRPDPTAAVLAALVVWTLLSLYTSPWTFGWILPLVALTVSSLLSRAVLAYVAVFAVTAQWGILTVAAKWLESPRFGPYDDVNAVGKSVLLLGLLAIVGGLLVDAVRRVARPGRVGPPEREVATSVDDRPTLTPTG